MGNSSFYMHYVQVKVIVLRQLQFGVKRTLDIFLGLMGLGILVIPFVIISMIIKLNSKGPVFFRQERVGKNGRPFKTWKFRTMIVGAVKRGLGYNVTHDDNRITRVGKFLREWGIDELPQLFNVLKGDMSIVGPRPTLQYQVDQYNAFQRRRLLAKPGITGWALIHGRNLLSWKERIKYDVWYVDHWSLGLDLWIMLKTLWIVLVTREGVYGKEGINDDFARPVRRGGGISDER
jgi:undecaprenyl phosphate N,N'-diacetylbacillosamine 1-phosphate transferase